MYQSKEARFMPDKNGILIYNTPNGDPNVEVYLCDEDIWMTQAALADLFSDFKKQHYDAYPKHL